MDVLIQADELFRNFRETDLRFHWDGTDLTVRGPREQMTPSRHQFVKNWRNYICRVCGYHAETDSQKLQDRYNMVLDQMLVEHEELERLGITEMSHQRYRAWYALTFELTQLMSRIEEITGVPATVDQWTHGFTNNGAGSDADAQIPLRDASDRSSNPESVFETNRMERNSTANEHVNHGYTWD